MTLVYIIISTIVISLASLVGIFFISMREEHLHKIIIRLVTFATGVLLGGAILHLIPEAFEAHINASLWVLGGIVVFFILEKFFFWRHCHNGICDIHPFSYLNLAGDGIHNFVDGTIIAASFIVNIKLGFVTSVIALAHELPQEIGDFGILVYGGFTKRKALFYNLLCSMSCILGGIAAYFVSARIQNLTSVLIAFAGGNFLYISLVDLLPELRKVGSLKESIMQLVLLVFGVFLMWLLRFVH